MCISPYDFDLKSKKARSILLRIERAIAPQSAVFFICRDGDYHPNNVIERNARFTVGRGVALVPTDVP